MSSSSNAGGQRPSFYCLIHFYKRYSRCDLLQFIRSWSERVARVKTDTSAKKGGHEFKLKCRSARLVRCDQRFRSSRPRRTTAAEPCVGQAEEFRRHCATCRGQLDVLPPWGSRSG